MPRFLKISVDVSVHNCLCLFWLFNVFLVVIAEKTSIWLCYTFITCVIIFIKKFEKLNVYDKKFWQLSNSCMKNYCWNCYYSLWSSFYSLIKLKFLLLFYGNYLLSKMINVSKSRAYYTNYWKHYHIILSTKPN